jgi:hypothetical protein
MKLPILIKSRLFIVVFRRGGLVLIVLESLLSSIEVGLIGAMGANKRGGFTARRL